MTEPENEGELAKRLVNIFTWSSVPLYCLVVNTLIKRRVQLNSSFFTLAIWCGVADLAYLFIARMCFGFFPKWFFEEIVRNSTVVATAGNMAAWGLYYSQVIGVLLTAVNRLTAFVSPIRYDKIWRGKRLVILVGMQWFLPLLAVAPMLFKKCRSKYSDTMIAWIADEECYRIYWIGCIVVECFLFAPSLFLMYLVTFFKIFIRKRKNKVIDRNTTKISSSSGSRPKTEWKLAFIGALLSILYIILCLSYVFSYFDLYYYYVDYVWRFVPDLFTILNPYFLLIFSRKVRQNFVQMYCCSTENL